MTCFKPVTAYRTADGITFYESRREESLYQIQIPCRQCIGCRLDKAQDWATRCMHESKLHPQNCFITLTYADEHLPEDNGLHHEHFQKFMKRLRKHFKGVQISYYMAGEYGTEGGRPHYHALIFGVNFDFDKKAFNKGPSGHTNFTSVTLEKLWPFGIATIGPVTYDTCNYTARYIMEKHIGKGQEHFYEWFNPTTGKTYPRIAEYNKMSTRPAIGMRFLDKFLGDVAWHDYVIIQGKKKPVPKAYLRKLKDSSDAKILDIREDIAMAKADKARANWKDNTDERLKVKEIVTAARTKQTKYARSLD